MWDHSALGSEQHVLVFLRQLTIERSRMISRTLVFLTISLLALFSIQSFAADALSDSEIKQTLAEVYQLYKNTKEGKNADYIPELATVNSNLFAIVVVTVDGKVEAIGDNQVPFAIESISKIFSYILALQDNGVEAVNTKVGLNATGHVFNSIIAIEEKYNHLQNPIVNAGAIQVTSLIRGKDNTDKWQRVFNFIAQLNDGNSFLGKAVYMSESKTNQRNRAIAELLASYGMINGDPFDALDRYTKACSIMVTTRQLALMGAVLANNGIHPITHQRLISAEEVRNTLAQMVTNGLYDESGTWFTKVGIPTKSGVGGGMLAVVPNKMAIAVFSPPLDADGNSVRGKRVIAELSQRWHLHLLDH